MEYAKQIDSIKAVYREMRFAENQRKRLDLALGAYVRTLCGYRTDLPPKERAAIVARASALVSGKATDDPLCGPVSELVESNKAASVIFRVIENRCEKQLTTVVRTLPVWDQWAKSVSGLGAKGIGIIIGEAGDVGSYRTEACLWKRMGLAVINGVAQGKLPANAPKDLWIYHGYNRKRRSAVFTIGDACVKASKSPYRTIYLARKKIEKARFHEKGYQVIPSSKITKKNAETSVSDGHIHRRAQRYMEKRILRHMYKAWRRTMGDCAEITNTLLCSPSGVGPVHGICGDAVRRPTTEVNNADSI